MTVTEKILAAIQDRLDSGVTYYAIAREVGVSQQIISRFHRGERKQIRSETIDRLCEYLGLDLQPTTASKAGGSATTTPAKGKAAPRTPPPFGDAGEVPKPVKSAKPTKRRRPAGHSAKAKASGQRSSGGSAHRR